jgi:hypothetical protein
MARATRPIIMNMPAGATSPLSEKKLKLAKSDRKVERKWVGEGTDHFVATFEAAD